MILFALAILLFAPLAHAQELLLAQTTPPRLELTFQAAPSSCTVATPSATVRTRQNQTSTVYTAVGTIPGPTQLPAQATFLLPATADNLFYTVRTACGTSNEVQYVATVPPPTGPTLEERVTTVETSLAALRLADQSLSSANVVQDTVIASIQAALAAAQSATQALVNRVTLLEAGPPPAPPAPTPTSNFTVTVIDADHLSIVGACTSIRSIYVTVTRRTIECVP